MSYTLITGASSGIGLKFAQQLAEQNENLVLVARREKKLLNIKRELEKESSIKVKIFVADLTDLNKIDELRELLEKEKIKIKTLINNAGFGTSGLFQDISLEKEVALTQLNITALVKISKVSSP